MQGKEGEMVCKFVIPVIMVMLVSTVSGQRSEESKFDASFGVGFGLPQGHTSDFVYPGGNYVFGLGYSFNHRFGVTGEVMSQGLPINQSALDQIGAPFG